MTKKKIKKDDLKSYNTVIIYKDWEKERGPIGTAVLIEKNRDGNPFILKDMFEKRIPKTQLFHKEVITEWETVKSPLSKFNVYSYERWKVKFINNTDYSPANIYTFNIRFFIDKVTDKELPQLLYKLYKEKEEEEDELSEEEYKRLCFLRRKLPDTFIKVNGVEIF